MLDWSYDRLPEPERVVLNRLSIFASEFTLEAAAMVAAGDDIATSDVADHVTSLVTKSLVIAKISGKEPLYRLLETTGAYAMEKLLAASELDVIAGRHAEHLRDILALAEKLDGVRFRQPSGQLRHT
jgi:predicted ATPase